MPVNGLNHVNIVTADMARTIEFYSSLLGMEAQPIPMAGVGYAGRWIVDTQGAPIIHVQPHNPERHGDPREGPTGKIDHVALTCADFDGTKQRCEELGLEYSMNDRKFGDLRQLFVTDPNEVRLELNFVDE